MGTVENSTTDRDPQGRFLPGNRVSPGRPRRHIETEYLASLADSVPLDLWRRITAKAVDDALAGDAKARDWLSKYLLGESARLEHLQRLNYQSESQMDFSNLSTEELKQLEQTLVMAMNQTNN